LHPASSNTTVQARFGGAELPWCTLDFNSAIPIPCRPKIS